MIGPDIPREFECWNDAVMVEMARIGRGRGLPLGVFDAVIPYEGGWEPERTARALLGTNKKDRAALAALVLGNYEDGR